LTKLLLPSLLAIDFLSKEAKMKIQIGNAVHGNDFFPRKDLIARIERSIASGSNILLVAPRRVGKTSLMFYLKDNPLEGFNFIFHMTESVSSEQEFYRKLLTKLITSEFVTNRDKVLSRIKEIFPAIKTISKNGVEFDSKQSIDYYAEFIRIIEKIELEGEKLVFLLDEFSQTVENIKNAQGNQAAIHFLQTNRVLRQTLFEKIQFIYSGSIGLENIVHGLNAVGTINDLTSISVKPLTRKQAKELVSALLNDVDYDLSEEMMDYILEKTKWLIPFYIQLIIQSIEYYTKDNEIETITEDVIEQAFEEMLEQKHCFAHWESRLRAMFKSDEYILSKELLNFISENDVIDKNEIYNLSVKLNLEQTYKDIVRVLIYDGYINNNESPDQYRFNSPILQMWWFKNVAN
jgi:hypothetical protein